MTNDMKTLGDYRKFFVILAGAHSRPVKFLDAKIAEQGADMEVLQDETQMMLLLGSMLDVEGEA